MTKLVRTIIVLTAIQLGLMPGLSAATSVELVLSSETHYYQKVAEVFTDQLRTLKPNVPIHRRILNSGHGGPPVREGSLVVAIGSGATREAFARYPQANVLALLIPMTLWLDLNPPARENRHFAAVVIDQPLERAVLLGKLLKPEAQRFGAVFGPATEAIQSSSLARVKAMGIDLRTEKLPANANPISVLRAAIETSDVFVAVPDRADFNRNVAKWVLRLSFRDKVPVIGFSSSYAEAGALASIYSSPENVGRHGAELLARRLDDSGAGSDSGDAEWRAHYPRYYTLQVNEDVARVLGIAVPPLEQLYRMYQNALQAM